MYMYMLILNEFENFTIFKKSLNLEKKNYKISYTSSFIFFK